MKLLRPIILDQLLKKYVKKAKVPEATLLVGCSKGNLTYQASHGHFSSDHRFLAASLTKLFISCLILQLVEEKKLSLEDKLTVYLDRELLEGLHVFEGQDDSFELTVANLLYQTSGLPDCYLEGADNFAEDLVHGDYSAGIQDRIRLTKNLEAHFKPGTSGLAFYDDINFNLLALLVEVITGQQLGALLQQKICQPLGLSRTSLIETDSENVPGVYLEGRFIKRPKFLAADSSSGLVTSAHDLLIFIKAFYTGQLFAVSCLESLEASNQLQAAWGPIRYGAGFMRLPLSRRRSAGSKRVELLGHTGSTGAVAFYYPQEGLFLVGTLQQMAQPDLVLRLLMELTLKL